MTIFEKKKIIFVYHCVMRVCSEELKKFLFPFAGTYFVQLDPPSMYLYVAGVLSVCFVLLFLLFGAVDVLFIVRFFYNFGKFAKKTIVPTDPKLVSAERYCSLISCIYDFNDKMSTGLQ